MKRSSNEPADLVDTFTHLAAWKCASSTRSFLSMSEYGRTSGKPWEPVTFYYGYGRLQVRPLPTKPSSGP